MSRDRGIVSRLFEGLGRVTWGVVKHKVRERRAQKHQRGR
jgi:hypothetical protein